MKENELMSLIPRSLDTDALKSYEEWTSKMVAIFEDLGRWYLTIIYKFSSSLLILY